MHITCQNCQKEERKTYIATRENDVHTLYKGEERDMGYQIG